MSYWDIFCDWPCPFCFQAEATCWCGSTYFKSQKKLRAYYNEQLALCDNRTITHEFDVWQFLPKISE